MFENKYQCLEINYQSLNNIRLLIQSLDQINTVDDPAFGKYHIAGHIKDRTYLKNKIRVQE